MSQENHRTAFCSAHGVALYGQLKDYLLTEEQFYVKITIPNPALTDQEAFF